MIATKTKTDNITLLPYRERVRLVQERLRDLARPKVTPLPKPARVVAAEKLAQEWDKKNDAHMEAQRAKHRAKKNEITDALIVGDMEKAVSLLAKHGV